MEFKEFISKIRQSLQPKNKPPTNHVLAHPPLPAELLSGEQMERYGGVLAASHKLVDTCVEGVLLRQLSDSELALTKVHRVLSDAARARDYMTPAGEWLLDNFYLIEDQIRFIRRHLSKKYEQKLPGLTGDFLQGCYPRIYDIAIQMIEHGDGYWDLENISRFIGAYQSVSELTLGELWAMPMMLRLALLRHLSALSTQIIAHWHDRHLAEKWADQMLEVAVEDPKKLVLVIADMVRSHPPMTGAFVAELTRRLQNAALALPLTWIEQKLAEEGLTIEQLVEVENTQQATHQVTVSNTIASMRRFSEVDWREFVENLSVVEQTLAQDPVAVYSHMDAITRDRYRHVVEKLARDSQKSEMDVAKAALHLAQADQQHVGFYLIDAGLPQLQSVLGIRARRKGQPLAGYLGLIAFIVFGLTSALLFVAGSSGVSTGWLITLGVVLVLCISQLAVAVVNWGVMLFVTPHALPRMDFSQGIPASCCTLVVVPAMLGSVEELESLVEALEIRFLGNKDPNLYFALLTDFKDASKENMPEDAALIALAETRITALNGQYGGSEKRDIFFLLHRPRRWSVGEQVWMGYERKRGKLNDLNALLRGQGREHFSVIVGQFDLLTQVKYVITLDSDTQLPRDSAHQYIGAMAHPLNHSRYDEVQQRVVAGYGILQPRIAEALPRLGPTRYVWWHNSDLGIDPYTRTVSNVYQDLFKEGSFTGKGIYDVDMFQQALAGRFPENRILSHDLLEGCYLRSGLLSDVPLYEHSPGSYLTDVKRRVRWIRGDWQIMGWLFTRGLSGLSRWKLFDNLRRSLVAPSLMMLLILGWTILPASHFWFGMILAILLLPGVIATLMELASKPKEMLFSQHLRGMLQVIWQRLAQLVFYLACLPHEAWYSLGAVVRTFWRLMISHQHLLEWVPSEQVDRSFHGRPLEWIRAMWMGPVVAFAMMVVLILNHRLGSLLIATPLLALWAASPLVARWLSQPFQCVTAKLDMTQQRFLHVMARRTWEFFDTFVTAQDNWLPPDNYQEAPKEILARRTSPTNIGLALLANLSAYDFGYINAKQLLVRTENTIQTMLRLERHRGHFYNWYDTETLAVLPPRYVSTVDGGNLAGHLLTLRQGLLELIDEPLLRVVYLTGLEDTLDVLIETVSAPYPEAFNHFRQLLHDAYAKFATWSAALNMTRKLYEAAEHLASIIQHEWSEKLLLQCHVLRDEMNVFAELLLPANATLRDVAMLEGRFQATQEAVKRIAQIEQLAAQAFELAQMDVSFLYNGASRLMSIGFNVERQERDRSDYDLLSSEARLANFVAIAQGQVPQESWFSLGRLQVMSQRGQPMMMSWSGSMFEYLMPLLVMPAYPNTLLDQVCRAAVNRHIEYGHQRGVPWGISESGYYAVDAQLNYQYRAFGVPELGFKRGLEEDLVVAPYATVMALMVEPTAACLNLQRLAEIGAVGRFGFYEAIDFTPTRLRAQSRELVRSFMVHHQGMSLLAFSYLLHDQPMQRRFAADPLFQSALLLLQERIPKPVASYFEKSTATQAPQLVSAQPETSKRVFHSASTRTPQVQLLSNGRYHVMLTQAGGGYSRWKDMAITRWREDNTCDNWGLFSYVRDVETGAFWSTSYQPTPGAMGDFKAIFSEGHAEFISHHQEIGIHTDIVVSPEDDIELRRFRVHNRSQRHRTLEFTSYAEVVLALQADDQGQPIFSNLFVETELLPEQRAILVTRRPRNEEEASPWLCHMLNVYSDAPYQVSFETDRAQFVGRARTLVAPYAMTIPGDLSNTSGTVLDPVVAIRCRITLEPGESITLDLLTGVTDARDDCIGLIEQYHDRHFADRVFGLAWTHSQVLLHQLDISESDAQHFEKLASAIIYTNDRHRAAPGVIASNRWGQSRLWGHSISGDLPIVLLHMTDAANIEILRKLVQAQAFWRRKGLIVDLVVINEEVASYRQMLQDQITSVLNMSAATEHKGSIFVRIAEQMAPEDWILLQSVACIVLFDRQGKFEEQVNRRRAPRVVMPLLKVSQSPPSTPAHALPLPKDLQCFNGLGGFSAKGDEYIIKLTEGKHTPLPWVNVLANPTFGTLVSESGQGYTWIENAHEFRLTPWGCDPVQDTSGEAFYVRDDESGRYWSPAALPCRGRGDYLTRHGFGYSVFEHIEEDIHTELWMYVALNASVKFMVLKIRNQSQRRRRLSSMGYVEWVLGDLREKNAMQVITELSRDGILLARNHYNTAWGERTAFFDAVTVRAGLSARSITGSRVEFLGRNRSRISPAALERTRLSGHVGAGLDPCGAIQLTFDLASGHSREIVFTLGAGQDFNDAERLAKKYRGAAAAEEALQAIRQYWHNTLSAVRISTPDPAVDLLANGWLLYQTLSSRIWGRTGYYQSSGAFGFRDQLQDVMSLVHTDPNLLRAQLLLCASRQFEEGDVQHWWHPPQGRGVRTRCSDDYLWLPFALCHYVEATGDIAILDEPVTFLLGRSLNLDEESYYDLPEISGEQATLYQHGVCSILHGLQFGEHGLPLMGSGDWNDGMSLVGIHGRGESVWLGFFLYTVLKRFARLAQRHGDAAFAARCQAESIVLQQNLEQHGWDGEWYRRAYFDDGSPLGSAKNTECRIDAIAQSWSVLSGAGESAHTKQAMASLNKYLARPVEGLIALLDPPFHVSLPNPGYIKGYVPGIRENGGQYTHAAAWAVMAFVELGEYERAWQLFNMINPINHSRTPEEVDVYKIEPYVTAGDVYSVAPHAGRGGWSWYTGSAAWMYRLIIESLLGVQLEDGKQLRLTPHLPEGWDGFVVDYRHGERVYHIEVSRSLGEVKMTVDGVALEDNVLGLS